MFPLRTLVFALWLVMVDPRLVSSDNASQKSIPFMMNAVKRLCQIVTRLCLCSSVICFGPHLAETLCTPSWLFIISCTEPWLMLRCATFVNQLSVIQNRGVDSFNVVCCCGRGWASISFISDTCATVFEHENPIRHSAVVKHCSHIVLKVCNRFLPLVHLQSTEIVSLHDVLWCIRTAERSC